MTLTVGSLFAGVGGFDIAAERAGMEVAWQSEVDPAASRVLEHHWPGLNLGDIHGITSPPAVDVLCGGFPCQDYSVAGTRSGLAGDRGALWWEYHRLIADGRPTWVVGENVPGLLSSNSGRDFATIVDSLVELGYGVVWGVLDAQYFGVAQRRRRVFIVGHSGGQPRPEVLALGEGLFGNPPPSRKARQSATGDVGEVAQSSSGSPTTGALTTAFGPRNYTNLQEVSAGSLVVGHHIQAELIGRNPDAGPNGKGVADINSDPAYTLNIAGGVQAVAFTESHRNRNPDVTGDITTPVVARAGQGGNNGPMVAFSAGQSAGAGSVGASADVAPTLRGAASGSNQIPTVAFAQNQRDEVRDRGDVAGALAAEPGVKQQTFPAAPTVRRLTPLECERLQGFPDGWTDIPGASDSQRYKQMGNAVAVPVVEWIMRRIRESV